nr:volume-regulated anion channel subunit LRRC8A-like [Nerophis lumbriciformis]
MFPIAEFQYLTGAQQTYRILKPWWDVFNDYISVVMLMIAVFGGTLQITQDKMICLPCKRAANESCQAAARVPHSAGQSRGIQNELDRHQYSYIDAVCYENELHWFAKYFPYLVLLHTLIFLACSNFWFKFPRTSSKLEHFVSILRKCFDSPWTTRALSETVAEERDSKSPRGKNNNNSSVDRNPSVLAAEDVEASVPAVQRIKSRIELGLLDQTDAGVLDKKEGEQAKALFEKVKKFRIHVEESDSIHGLYMFQTLIKVVMFLLIISYASYYVGYIRFSVVCEAETENLTGFGTFYCAHPLATLLKILTSFYISLVLVYGLIAMYSLCWMLRRTLKLYSFEAVREESRYSDIPDLKNDFAFMLHMLDQYDPLYSKRLAVFLSEVSENKLRQLNLNNEWTAEKLRQHISENSQKKVELHLCMLSGIPETAFDLLELEALKMEFITNVTIPPIVAKLSNLRELRLYHTPAKIESAALTFLQEKIKCLHVKFADIKEIPLWIYSLKNLNELHLTSNCYIVPDRLRELKKLKVLRLKNNLHKLPQVVTDLSPHLQKLSINNEGTKLLVLNNMNKMVNLIELELVRCDLERIPHCIFSLHNLQQINLKDNNLKTDDEIAGLELLRQLVCLKLWYNQIAYIPIQIGSLANLDKLYLNKNKIEKLPTQLFLCHKLRLLDLSHNNLTGIPPHVGSLQKLQHFAVAENRIEKLPVELFMCKKLRVLQLTNNCLETLPSRVGELVDLTLLELRGNDFVVLPPELGECRRLQRSGLVVEDKLFNTLPPKIKDQLMGIVRERA